MAKAREVKLRIPATIGNLGSGFDCIGMAVSLYNEFKVSENEELKIEVHGEGEADIPTDMSNLIYKSFCEFYKEIGKEPPMIRIYQKNSIPLARGLGSSATAVLCGLISANILSGRKMSNGEILKLASKLEGHADNVVPALLGGLCISIYDGEITFLKNRLANEIKVVMCIPEFQLPTKKAREILPEKVTLQDAIFNCSRTALLINSLIKKRYELLRYAVEDKLHQPYRAELIPGMYDVITSALDSGALCSGLSGAGPSIFALATNRYKNIGENMVRAFLKHRIKSVYKVLKIDNDGTRIW